jgi:hypothetical protein
MARTLFDSNVLDEAREAMAFLAGARRLYGCASDET